MQNSINDMTDAELKEYLMRRENVEQAERIMIDQYKMTICALENAVNALHSVYTRKCGLFEAAEEVRWRNKKLNDLESRISEQIKERKNTVDSQDRENATK